jgi:magnesium-transporting ATPase (P-type)
MTKEGYEDRKKQKVDEEVNSGNTAVYQYSALRFAKQLWCNIKVGDIVLVQQDEEAPADLLILSAPKDVVFADTINLDGEMGVKQKYPFIKGVDTNNLQFL